MSPCSAVTRPLRASVREHYVFLYVSAYLCANIHFQQTFAVVINPFLEVGNAWQVIQLLHPKDRRRWRCAGHACVPGSAATPECGGCANSSSRSYAPWAHCSAAGHAAVGSRERQRRAIVLPRPPWLPNSLRQLRLMESGTLVAPLERPARTGALRLVGLPYPRIRQCRCASLVHYSWSMISRTRRA